jgi:5-methyltetrahydropteroyltriglutamate--homocysteine methyltransferase
VRARPRPSGLQEIVPKQIDAGIDIGNDGEQQREGFFLHVRHRMTGFGGGLEVRGQRPSLRGE